MTLFPSEVERVERRLRRAGLALEVFLDRHSISRVTWWRWRTGKAEPAVTKWRNVMNALRQVESRRDHTPSRRTRHG